MLYNTSTRAEKIKQWFKTRKTPGIMDKKKKEVIKRKTRVAPKKDEQSQEAKSQAIKVAQIKRRPKVTPKTCLGIDKEKETVTTIKNLLTQKKQEARGRRLSVTRERIQKELARAKEGERIKGEINRARESACGQCSTGPRAFGEAIGSVEMDTATSKKTSTSTTNLELICRNTGASPRQDISKSGQAATQPDIAEQIIILSTPTFRRNTLGGQSNIDG